MSQSRRGLPNMRVSTLILPSSGHDADGLWSFFRLSLSDKDIMRDQSTLSIVSPLFSLPVAPSVGRHAAYSNSVQALCYGALRTYPVHGEDGWWHECLGKTGSTLPPVLNRPHCLARTNTSGVALSITRTNTMELTCRSSRRHRIMRPLKRSLTVELPGMAAVVTQTGRVLVSPPQKRTPALRNVYRCTPFGRFRSPILKIR